MNYWNKEKEDGRYWKEYWKKRREAEAKEREFEKRWQEIRDRAFLKAKKEDLNDWKFLYSKLYNENKENCFTHLEIWYDEVLEFKTLEEFYKNRKYCFPIKEDTEKKIIANYVTFRYMKEVLIPKIETHEYFEEFLKWKHKEKYEILEFLIPSFPVKIKSGNTKTTSNKTFFPTAYAIDNHKFINYNSKERINFLCFDLDYHDGAEAIKSFPTIQDFKKHLIDQLGAELEPSFIIQTTKGYQFFYHLKVPVLAKYKNSIQF